jgi:hypothetical protein
MPNGYTGGNMPPPRRGTTGQGADVTTGGNVRPRQQRTTAAPHPGRVLPLRMRRRHGRRRKMSGRQAADALLNEGRRPAPTQRPAAQTGRWTGRGVPPERLETGRMPPQRGQIPQMTTGRWTPPERGTRTTVAPPPRRPGQPPPASQPRRQQYQGGVRRGQMRRPLPTMMTGGNMPPPQRR